MKPLRTALKLGVALFVLNALYQFAPPYWRYVRFKSEVQDVALAARGKPDAAIVDDVMRLARARRVPIEREWIEVSRSEDLTHTYVDATWSETMTFLPKRPYEWIFRFRADGWHVRALAPDDVR